MILFLVILIFTSPDFAMARKGTPDTEALYIVPSKPEFVSHSRFIVDIIEPFKGPQTKKISYIFPEVLTGEPAKVIELEKIEGTVNSWKGPELTAHCNILEDTFSCNIHVNKDQTSANFNSLLSWFIPEALAQAPSRLHKDQALANLKSKGLPQNDLHAYTEVIDSFYASDPAGFLIYEFQ